MLHVTLIRHGLLRVHGYVRYVVRRHMRRHSRSARLRGQVRIGRLLRRFDLVGIVDAILVALGRLRRVQASLDEILSLRLGYQRLELGGGKCVHKPSLRHDKQQNLSARQNRQLVCLLHYSGLALGEGDVTTRLVANELYLNFATLATSLLIIIIVVVRDTSALALDATVFCRAGIAIADVGIVEFGGRSLIVLVCDVGHFYRGTTIVSRTKKAKMVEILFWSWCRRPILDLALSGEALGCSRL